MCRRVEIGFDFRGGEQIFKADAGRMRRLADRPGHRSRMNGLVLRLAKISSMGGDADANVPGQPAEHGGIMVNEW
jgi:hypothetical protein